MLQPIHQPALAGNSAFSGHPGRTVVPTGLLLVGHGTRDPDGVEQFRDFGRRLAASLPGQEVTTSFLEFAEPGVAAGIDELASRGHRHIAVVPLLLFAAGHAKRDIPELLAAARQRWPAVELVQTPHLGCQGDLVELSARRFMQCLAAGAALVDREHTLLVLVGRGSTDPTANAEMAQFARLRFERTPVGWYELGFTAMAEPGLERALEIASRLPFTQVVVQPHLLFAGRLLDRVRETAWRAAERAPGQHWRVTEALGCDPLLIQAVISTAGLVAGQAGE